MRKSAISLALMLALGGTAHAAEWVHQTDDYGHEAWQGSTDEKYLLAFFCGDDADDGAFYILTPEPYEASTSYAAAVPTTFTASGKKLEMSGVFEERTGSVSVYFEATDDNALEIAQLYNLISGASGDIKVSFFDKQMSFSSEGAAAALNYAADGRPGNCNAYGPYGF